MKWTVWYFEVDGTVGDIESMVFLEALRQFQYEWDIECGTLKRVVWYFEEGGVVL